MYLVARPTVQNGVRKTLFVLELCSENWNKYSLGFLFYLSFSSQQEYDRNMYQNGIA